MTEQVPDDETAGQPRQKKRVGKVRVLPPAVVPMNEQDYEQAVTALAAMIAAWWHDHQSDPTP